MNGSILVVDDENGIRWALKHKLSRGGHQVITAETGEEALEKLDADLDVVLVDVRMPGMDGLSFIRKARRLQPKLQFVAMTGCGTVDTAARARKVGAAEFLEKPFKLDEVENTIQKLLKDRPRVDDKLSKALGKPDSEELTADGAIIGKSLKMKEIFSVIRRLRRSSTSTVLITGESGTGKELVARAIHYTSSRRAKRFTEINCAALSESLLEAELFGYEKGAFTGAAIDGKVGLFEATEGGTIFLDEVGEMGVNLQAKLLRVLQEKTFRKVGGIETIQADVRVIASTNRDLHEQVREGKFREDLYYRLNVVPVRVPPLRERNEDILLIANYYLDKFNDTFNAGIAGFDPEVEKTLKVYHWPGNVRELKNVVERAVLMESGKRITDKFLMLKKEQPRAAAADSLLLTDRSLVSMEKQLIGCVLAETRWQRSEAAKILGIHRTTLAAKIKDYGLDSGVPQNTTN
jgi:two-component system response regulator AtoC